MIDHTEILWLADTPIAVLKRRPGSTDGGPSGGGTATPWTGTPAGGVDIYFIHPDHLDSPRALVNANDQLIWRWDSSPFGDTDANEQPTAGITTFVFNLRFPGQQYDREIGTHYNYFRDYEAGIGRYVQSDPIGLEDDASLFSYAGCDPISYVDAVGEKRSRAGRAEAIRNAENDPKQPRYVLGWFKNERRHAAQGGRPSESAGKWRREGNKAIRLPPGYDLAHRKGEESCKGHGYRKCTLKDKATYQNETRAQRLKGVFGAKALPPLGPKIRINLLKRPRK